jgi:hypothetical protein
MNRGQITGENGRIDYELVAAPPRGLADAPIVVREYNAHFCEHRIVFEGCMNFEHISRLGAPSGAALPPGAVDPDLPVAMASE